MSIPDYLKQYTKKSTIDYLDTRDKFVGKRAYEVGVQTTCQETGWEVDLVRKCLQTHLSLGPEEYVCKVVSSDKNCKLLEIYRNFPNFLDQTISDIYSQIGQDPPRHTELTEIPETCYFHQPENLPNGCSKIELTRGFFAMVDTEDLERLLKYSWAVQICKKTLYAFGSDISQSMHRTVMGCTLGDGQIVDHINHNGIDNRKCNLRIVPRNLNNHNIRLPRGKTSRFNGVSYHKQADYWVTCIRINKKPVRKYLKDEVVAALLYDKLALLTYGPTARTNLAMGIYSTEEIERYRIGV